MNNQDGGLWQKFLALLSQTLDVGGLEISEEGFRFILLKGKNTITASLRLPQGIVGKGGILNKEQFKEALKVFRNKLSGIYGSKEKANVIVSLPFSRTYLQVFKIPAVGEKGTEEAVALNMQMISPIPIETAYYDSEKISEVDNVGQMEFLGVFAPAAESDAFNALLKEAGFNVLAIEFSTLSLARFFRDSSHGFDVQKPYLLINITKEGAHFIILRSGRMYFNFEVSWQAIRGTDKIITEEAFNASLLRAFNQVLNFYSSRWGGDLKTAVILAPAGVYENIKKLAESLGLEARPFRPVNWPNLDENWYTALGLALRGIMPRSKDNLVTLSKIDTEEEYNNEQIVAFSRFWRNIAFIILNFFVVILLISNFFLKGSMKKLEAEGSSTGLGSQSQVVVDLGLLREESMQFNRLVDAVVESVQQRVNWSDFFERIYVLAGNEVIITRVFYQAENVPVVISGKSASVDSILAFRDRIVEEPDFTNVNLPLSNVSQAGGEVLFNLSFVFK